MQKNKTNLTKDSNLTFEGTNNEVWYYDEAHLKAYTDSLETKRRLTKVAGSLISSRYYDSKTKKVSWDFLIPNKRLNTVMRILSNAHKKEVSGQK